MSAITMIMQPWSLLAGLPGDASSPDAAVTALAAIGLELVALWMSGVLLLGLLAALPGAIGRTAGRAARGLTPVLVRRIVVAAIGISGVSAPAGAWAGSPPITLDLPAPGQPAGDVGSRPVASSPAPVVAAPSPPTPAAARVVTVHPGDTLWGLARAALPAGAGDRTIATAWPQWWELNRAVIGADPGLLLPGQQLLVPGGAA